jgi:hypothetical protein
VAVWFGHAFQIIRPELTQSIPQVMLDVLSSSGESLPVGLVDKNVSDYLQNPLDFFRGEA